MTFIDEDLVVKIGDGEVIFEDLGLAAWTATTEADKGSMEEQAKYLFSMVKDVKGLQYKDGSPVTADSLKASRAGVSFYIELKKAWTAEVFKTAKAGSVEKNG